MPIHCVQEMGKVAPHAVVAGSSTVLKLQGASSARKQNNNDVRFCSESADPNDFLSQLFHQ